MENKFYIYSVFITLNSNIEESWLAFMNNKHLLDVMKTGCFTGYSIVKELNTEIKDKVKYRIDYTFLQLDKIELYNNKFAENLRNDVKERFEGSFEAERRVYEIYKQFI